MRFLAPFCPATSIELRVIALCSFNPVYGQGITVSALEAEQLGAALAASKSEGGLGSGFSARWFGRVKAIVDAAWDGVRIEDTRFPQLSSGRSLRLKASQWYVGRLTPGHIPRRLGDESVLSCAELY